MWDPEYFMQDNTKSRMANELKWPNRIQNENNFNFNFNYYCLWVLLHSICCLELKGIFLSILKIRFQNNALRSHQFVIASHERSRIFAKPMSMSQEISPPPNICPPGTRFLGHTGAWQKKEPPIKIVLVSIIIK